MAQPQLGSLREEREAAAPGDPQETLSHDDAVDLMLRILRGELNNDQVREFFPSLQFARGNQ
jgi:anthranilate phosphoribosyltransferase